MMETDRLLIRPLMEEDCASFTGGIADASLRAAYGFRPDMDGRTAAEVFRHFCNLEKAYSLIEKKAGSMIGFLLDVDPELPEEISDGLPEKGHTLAYDRTSPEEQGQISDRKDCADPRSGFI